MMKLTDEAKHLTKLRNNSGKTTYTEPSHGYGRRFSKNGLSLALLRKEVRHTMCKDYYIDFDMKNAHPEILLQVLIKRSKLSGQLSLLILSWLLAQLAMGKGKFRKFLIRF